MNKKIIVLMMALVLLLAGCGAKEEGVVATVDGESISQEKFDLYYRIQRQAMVAQFGEEALEQPMDKLNRTAGELMREDLLNNLILNQVILNSAKDAGIENVDDQVAERIAAEKEISGEDQFKATLDSLNITEEEYKEIWKDNLIVSQFRDQKMEEYEVSDEEVNDFYEENKDYLVEAKARHILVETEEEAKSVLERLDNGEDFGDLAKELSLDPGSAENGGVYDYFPRGRMVPEFDEFVFNAEVGEISEPVETTHGFHIIELLDIRNNPEDFREIIETQLKAEKFQDEMEEAKEKANVKTFIDLSKEPESIKQQIEEEKANENENVEVPEEGSEDSSENENN